MQVPQLREQAVGEMNLVWVDTETNGLDPQYNYLLEVGIIITDANLDIVSRKSFVIKHTIDSVHPIREATDSNVQQMHDDSGLWKDIEANGISHAEAEMRLLQWLADNNIEPKTSPMCGSTVQFDRSFLREWMPKLEAFFHYRNIDVSTIKELAKLWNKTAYDLRPSSDVKRHRALMDAQDSIAELLNYKMHFLRVA